MTGFLLFCVVELSGVIGADLHARAFFDAHNVKVGDPLVLTVDFLGEADFTALHPPALSKVVDSKDWKLDDVSAKTETFETGRTVVGRRITYRVRPRREGVLWFPALEFSYRTVTGANRMVRSNSLPVHAKAGRQVDVTELGEDLTSMPMPDELITACPAGVSDDLEFAWRKACASPSAAAFAEFDFPEGRLNEARCAILDGHWSRALEIYRSLEWKIGQTPVVERGMVAALARKYDNPAAELPVWRQVGRPILKYPWTGRVGIVLGSLGLLALVFWLLNRGIRAVATVTAALLLILPAAAEMTVKETVTTNADGSVSRRIVRTSSGGNGSMSFTFSSSSTSGGGGQFAFPQGFEEMQSVFDDDFFASPFGRRRKREPIRIQASAQMEQPEAMVGETFNLILSVDMPRRCRFVDGLQFSLEERPGLSLNGRPYLLDEQKTSNPTNILRRYVFPYRSLQPIRGPLNFTVAADIISGGGGFGFFRSSTPYRQAGQVTGFSVKPLPMEGCPADFSGIVADEVMVQERADIRKVETNDVVTITYLVKTNGYVPENRLPSDVAYEWQRSERDDAVEYRRYFVADGAETTPQFEIPYYSPSAKEYRRARANPTHLEYLVK